jgi:hypothetical protein
MECNDDGDLKPLSANTRALRQPRIGVVGSFVNTPNSQASTILLRMICAKRVHDCVILQEGSLDRFSSCSAIGL